MSRIALESAGFANRIEGIFKFQSKKAKKLQKGALKYGRADLNCRPSGYESCATPQNPFIII